jgi:uncharacterized protein (DUF1015 family)
MANILPFAAWRYDSEHVRLEDVLTQPYDKITPEMQQKYYDTSAYNLVRVELGQARPEDDTHNNVYTRAAENLRRWREVGVLQADSGPCIYAYAQRFDVPGPEATRWERRGFIALCHLRDYAENVVFRHEQTLAKPKSDRLQLLRATHVNTGQIFMLYPDETGAVEEIIYRYVYGSPPTAEMTDEYGVEHRLWPVSDQALILQVREMMVDKRLVIADGHHRYETALTYRNERRLQEMEAGKVLMKVRTGEMPVDTSLPYEFVMATFVAMESKGLLVLPTHRVVFGLEFREKEFLRSAEQYFEVRRLDQGLTPAQMVQALVEAGERGTAFVMVTRDARYLLLAREGEMEKARANVSPTISRLDVTRLHQVVLQHLMGITEEDIREQRHLNYLRDAEEAVQRVESGANAAFLMNPVRMEQLKEAAFAGQVMPQKSTDFYPKLLSGLTIYAMD